MAWKIEFAESASRTLGKLDKQTGKRIVAFLKERVLINPRTLGEALKSNLSPLWRYRVGDYRIICDIQNERLMVIIVKIGQRREVY